MPYTIMTILVALAIVLTFIIGVMRIIYPKKLANEQEIRIETIDQYTGTLMIGFSLIAGVLLVSL